MAKRKDSRRETAWLTVRQLADALDVTEAFVRREVLRRVPDTMIRRESRPMTVYGRGAIVAWLGEPDAEDAGDAVDEVELMLIHDSAAGTA